MSLMDRVVPGSVRHYYLRRYALVALGIVAGGLVLATVVESSFLLVGYFSAGFAVVGATTGRRTVGALTDLRERAEAFEGTDRLDPEDIETDVGIGREDELGRLYDAFGAMSAALQKELRTVERARERAYEERQELEDAQAEATEAKQRAERLNDHLERKAADYETVMERAAAGDLTQRMDPDSESGAMTAIGETFNEMMAALERTMVGTVEFADEVTTATDEISVSASEITHTSDTVSDSVQEIAGDANDQHETLERTSDEVEDVSATIEEIAASADEVAAKSEAAAEYGEEASEYATDAVSQMDTIQETATESIERVERLDGEIEQIGEVVDLIDDIADQTNILALNAAIEAERAGQGGAGFTVVAEEVKELAEETNRATEEVRERIGQVKQATDGVVTDMHEMDQQVSRGGETVEQALDALEEIVDRVTEADEGVQSISDATDEQARSTQQIVDMIDEVSEISRETADRASDTAAAAQEQTASVTEVNDSVQSLSDHAESLNELLAQFSVDDSRDVDLDTDSAQVTADASVRAVGSGRSEPAGADSSNVDATGGNEFTASESPEVPSNGDDGSTGAAAVDRSPEHGDDSAATNGNGDADGLDIADGELPAIDLDEATAENAENLFESE
ncbi:methyl-accepting chemotaxis protein [Halorientalis salina]|uniref:methyl-accepting chemotaxis protein n=1 Tax=Halorientalis salina TaxID=2932266 RepID=UPI0010AD9A0E|nr:methyl-accepting chemotaxis protein [Halorientalis salina]